MTPEEVEARGWDAVDVVFVTGDAYVDHPSFAMALLGRLLQSDGYRVAILSQPDWHSCRPWQTFGRPRLCFAISAGNIDSMVNHYTANRKVRSDDAYSPDGKSGRRPDRATMAYCQRAREAYKGVPIVAGGVEASLRRIAHYDYWSDKVRRAIIMDAKPDLIVYGMGERTISAIVRRLDAGQAVGELRDLPGIAYRLGAKEELPEYSPRPGSLLQKGATAGLSSSAKYKTLEGTAGQASSGTQIVSDGLEELSPGEGTIELPSYEEVAHDREAFCRMTRIAHRETDPESARRLVQYHDRERVVVNPPAMPLSEAELDRAYELPYTRRPHPAYAGRRIPAYETVKDSIQIVRGCFGGCTFCSIAAHQGRIVQSRSRESVLAEIDRMAAESAFSGTISDLGGPTANMYRMNCSRPEIRRKCRRPSCLYPKICKLLVTDHGPLVDLMKAARRRPGVKRVFVASGVRMDLAQQSKSYISHLARHHVGGLLKVAPEHCDAEVLRLMRKPTIENFESFARRFSRVSKEAGKEQYLVPYLMAGHPGSDLHAMIDLAVYLKRSGYRVEQVQDFLPGPFDLATCMYHTGMDPITGAPVHVAKGQRERKMQRALLQYFKPENYREVRRALEETGRTNLIGNRPDCLIPTRPPKAAGGRSTRHRRQ